MNTRKKLFKKIFTLLGTISVCLLVILSYIRPIYTPTDVSAAPIPESTTAKVLTEEEKASISAKVNDKINLDISNVGTNIAEITDKISQKNDALIEGSETAPAATEGVGGNTPTPLTESSAQASESVAEGGGATGLKIYFLDVGQADAAIIVCDNEALVIDGGNTSDSSYVFSFLQKNLGLKSVRYVIATHPHEDHVGGLAGVLNAVTVDDKIMCSMTEYSNKSMANFKKYTEKQGKEIYVPQVGETFTLGDNSSGKSGTFTILGPIQEDKSEINNMSIVLKFVYGDVSVMFTGDMEREEEADVLAAGGDLKSTVLKVAHHGSESSTTYPWLNAVMPEYAIISSSTTDTQNYDHPDEATLSKLRDEGAKLYRTDKQGTITLTSDGTNIEITTEKNPDIDTYIK